MGEANSPSVAHMGEANSPSVAHMGYDISPLSRVNFLGFKPLI